jgi:DNA modification methylase
MDVNCNNKKVTDRYAIYNVDTTEGIKMIPDNKVDLIMFSPPFNALYVYSNSPRDLGNSHSDEEFFTHFGFIVEDMYRILKPGRIMAVHCMQIPAMKERDGYIGIKDFRGDLIRLFQKYGFIYHSEVTVWKSPVVEMQRTKALGLLHKQIKKDSSMSRMGLPDYVVFMRKPGENAEPITHTNDTYPVGEWQNVASPVWEIYPSEEWWTLKDNPENIYPYPVWWDIDQSNTLNRMFNDAESEKHICCLQLGVIERIVKLYSNEGDLCFTPFLGVGSEVYQAVKMGRKGIGMELKTVYWEQARKNLETLDDADKQMSLFDFIGGTQ